MVESRAGVRVVSFPRGILPRLNLHLHDLRHTRNTLAAQSGASLRDLMARMGHDSPAAALIYQHSSRAADQAIAAALDARLAKHASDRSGREADHVPVEAVGPVWGPDGVPPTSVTEQDKR